MCTGKRKLTLYLEDENIYREPPDWLRLSSRYSLDCSKASTGLFWGILVLTVTIISLILFFVFIRKEKNITIRI